MALDKDKIKESLTRDDITKIMLELGSEQPRNIGGNLVFSTMCHNLHNGSHKLYYYDESKMFRCYTNCGNMDIYQVVMSAKILRGYEFTFPQAVDFVANVTGRYYHFDVFNAVKDSYIIDDWSFIDGYKLKEKPKITLEEYDSTVLECFRQLPHVSWLNEGISWETMKKFNISYDVARHKIVIPHYDMNGRLVGIRGRAMLQEDLDKGQKYMPLTVGNQMYNHPLGFNLYGFNLTKDSIRRNKEVIIFEGEKSCLLCDTMYGDNNYSVAVGGSHISNVQRDMIVDEEVEVIVICFDKEYQTLDSKEFEIFRNEMLKLAKKFNNYADVYIVYDREDLIGYKESPIDRGQEIFEKLLKQKERVVFETKNESEEE